MKMLYNDLKGNSAYIDEKDNIKTIVADYHYSYYCLKCGRDEKEAKVLNESGYYERKVISRCKCGALLITRG